MVDEQCILEHRMVVQVGSRLEARPGIVVFPHRHADVILLVIPTRESRSASQKPWPCLLSYWLDTRMRCA